VWWQSVEGTLSPSCWSEIPSSSAARAAPGAREGLGSIRRAVLFSMLAWLPIAVWALSEADSFQGCSRTPLSHFAVGVDSSGNPLLVLSDSLAEAVLGPMVPRL
jgi:hypothetical protein